jgi:hypothetical protein
MVSSSSHQFIKFSSGCALITCHQLVISDRMIRGKSEFGSRCLIETFSAKVAMPEHPTPFDNPVKAVGVMRAEDVPRSMVLNGIRFAFFHCALLSVPTKMLTRYERTKSSSQVAINAFINILKLEWLRVSQRLLKYFLLQNSPVKGSGNRVDSRPKPNKGMNLETVLSSKPIQLFSKSTKHAFREKFLFCILFK